MMVIQMTNVRSRGGLGGRIPGPTHVGAKHCLEVSGAYPAVLVLPSILSISGGRDSLLRPASTSASVVYLCAGYWDVLDLRMFDVDRLVLRIWSVMP